ncbi:ankyrin repeat protein [Colletotrichum kahawae]|uniref:Ankyrin repeat protein n=1 Tax=Colletotrichum kahawae TaxID=34407 RepID=A0AAD9YSG2_COLKA|nr:ankyrin repeat protein [Colletotrichum kahawae]
MLRSIIIEFLLQRHNTGQPQEEKQVAYIYFSYAEQHSDAQVIGCLIAQLLQRRSSSLSMLQEHWESRNDGMNPPLKDKLAAILRNLIHERRTYFVFDGLEECSLDTRSSIWQTLPWDVLDASGAPMLSVLVTSRPLENLSTISKGFKVEHIRGNVTDLNLFINHEVEQWLCDKSGPSRDDRDILLDQARTEISKRWNHMFLVAKLQIESLVDQLTVGAFRNRLAKLPTNLDETYSSMMSQICSSKKHRRDLAFDILSWVAFGRRRLTLMELQHALLAGTGATTLDNDSIYSPSDIRDVCRGFVTIPIRSDDPVTLVHYTASDYLNSRWKPEHATRLARTHASSCVVYLSFQDLEERENDSEERYAQKKKDFPFVYYAANWLGHHVRETPPEFGEEITGLLRSLLYAPEKLRFLSRVLQDPWVSGREDYPRFIHPNLPDEATDDFGEVTPMHVAAFLGWEPLVTAMADNLDDTDYEALDNYGQPPIAIAINTQPLRGGWDIVELLGVERSVDLTTEIGHCMLKTIAQSFHEGGKEYFDKIAASHWERLAQFGNPMAIQGPHHLPVENFENIQQFMSQLQLIHAVSIESVGYLSNIRNLGDTGIWGENLSFLGTALFIAVELESLNVVEILATRGVSVNIADIDFSTPLHRAALRCCPEIVEVLVECGANLEAKDYFDETPLFVTDSPEVADVLLQHGANPNNHNQLFNSSVLDYSIASGLTEKVRCLLSYNASTSGGERGTSLHTAARRGQPDIIRLLLNEGGDLEINSTCNGKTALDMAYEYGNDVPLELHGIKRIGETQMAMVEMLRHEGPQTALEIGFAD